MVRLRLSSGRWGILYESGKDFVFKMPGDLMLTEISSNKSFGGFQKVFSHYSNETKCDMKFGIYLPPQAQDKKLPVLYWLSGLTCTEQNFIQKSGFQKYASEMGVIVVNPDTSPRGCNIEGEDDSWDFGSGAGGYVDAIKDPWKNNYRMYSYVTKELPLIIEDKFPVLSNQRSIFGHSMGGHGALICALKNPGFYKSVSAFAPIANPIKCPWGIKMFSGYLGDESQWPQYDACELAKKYEGPPLSILVDQGKADNFLTEQLLPERLVDACRDVKSLSISLQLHEGYDHSYFFIASFIEHHFKHHAAALGC